MNQEEAEYLASKLLLWYGDLLKVSRVHGVDLALPVLRRLIAKEEIIRELYKQYLDEEIEGMGLSDNQQLRSLQQAQLEALEAGDPRNNTAYADEIKKIITKGKADHREGQQVYVTKSEFNELRVDQYIRHPLDFDENTLTPQECSVIRERLLGNFKVFSLWAFQLQMGFEFLCMDYHEVMFEFCDKIIKGEEGFHRTVINIPPRGGKTQIISIFLPLFAFCHNAGSHNMLLSFNESVVLESSGYVRTLMLDDKFMKVFPDVRIDQAKRSLDKWGTTRAGVLHAITGNGKVTGRGAGSLSTKFSGIQCIDDILKPMDAYSPVERTKVNDNYTNTLLSRLACDGFVKDGQKFLATPQVIIMQRLHDQDLCGHLFRGGSGARFKWLNIPALITPETGSKKFYDTLIAKHAYTHADPYLYDLGREEAESSFWEARKSLQSLKDLQLADPYNFQSQYMGDPTAKGTGIIQDEWFRVFDPNTFDYNKIMRTFIVADTASTTKSYSDYSVLFYVGVGDDNNLYVLDIDLGKWGVVDLKQHMIDFWNKHNEFDIQYPRLLPWNFYCEDKSSGHYLIQDIGETGKFNLTPIPRDKTAGDKLARFLNCVPYFSQGRVLFPDGHIHLPHVRRELCSMTNLGSGTGHDDCCDVTTDACGIAFGSHTFMDYSSWL